MWINKKKLINYNNKRENENWVQHNYEVGHYAYILRDGNYHKLEGENLGPFRITKVHTNGYVIFQRGIANKQINIQRLTPHFGYPPT